MVLCFWAPGMAGHNSGRRVWEEAAHLMVSGQQTGRRTPGAGTTLKGTPNRTPHWYTHSGVLRVFFPKLSEPSQDSSTS